MHLHGQQVVECIEVDTRFFGEPLSVDNYLRAAGLLVFAAALDGTHVLLTSVSQLTATR